MCLEPTWGKQDGKSVAFDFQFIRGTLLIESCRTGQRLRALATNIAAVNHLLTLHDHVIEATCIREFIAMGKEPNQAKLIGLIKANKSLDQIHVMDGGQHGKMVPINSMHYPSPRRIHVSMLLDTPRKSYRHNCKINWLYLYESNGRKAVDTRARPMPPLHAKLGKHLWKLAGILLSAVSQQCPPNSIEILVQFPQLGGRVPVHHDPGDILEDRPLTKESIRNQTYS